MKASKMTRFALVFLALCVVPACGKKEEEKEKKAEVAKKEAKPKAKKEKVKIPRLAPDSPRTAVGDFAVPAELEDEARRTVAIENLEAELDRLEAEITVGD